MKSIFHIRILLPVLLLAGTYQAHAQQDENALDTVVITGIRQAGARSTVLNIEPLRVAALEEKGPVNLTAALARTPGIRELSTGTAISKPVIRGLYGNRILVLLSGLRFDNQQWQDEHGMGLSYIGIDRVEVIKGPASILYGTDAVGGVLNIIDEQPDFTRKKLWDASTRFDVNTLGTLTDIGYKYSTPEKWARIRVGVENHADYSDGNGNRVLNTRNNGYYLKAGVGRLKNNWKTDNTYSFSFNNFGFVIPDLATFFSPDARWSRSMAGPHHIVLLNVLSSQNTIQLRNSLLRVNAGFQSNLRMEDEGGGEISLNMHLMSLLSHLRWEKHISDKTLFVVSNQLTYENNTNYGGRIIIPDANLFEGSVSAFISRKTEKLLLEAGAGVGDKYIKTFQTGILNSPGKAAQPFGINRTALNGIAGIGYTPVKDFIVKGNVSTGFRAPNLAELSSNGLHEGIEVYEIGDPSLKIEQAINGDISLEFSNDNLFFSLSGFTNKFLNYIYLARADRDSLGYPLYHFVQQNAMMYGGEAQVKYKPAEWVELSAGYDMVEGLLEDKTYMPFIPAKRVKASARLEREMKDKKWHSFFAEPEVEYLFAQNHAAVREKPTPDYYLVNLYTGIQKKLSGNNKLEIGISGTNLLNEAYADHLSRLRNYEILNPGRNITARVHITF